MIVPTQFFNRPVFLRRHRPFRVDGGWFWFREEVEFASVPAC